MSYVFSRLDTDFYNLTMGQVIWKYWRDLEVTYEFKCRDKTNFTDKIQTRRLLESLTNFRHATFDAADTAFLHSTGMFCEEYLDWLSTSHRLPAISLQVDGNGVCHMSHTGRWADAVLWGETPLSLMNEQVFAPYQNDHEGWGRLNPKLDLFSRHPDVRFMEFGTRRRFSQSWQMQVVERLVAGHYHKTNLVGTSNPMLAEHFGLPVNGTMAHQLFMVVAAKVLQTGPTSGYPLGVAEELVLNAWEATYANHPQMMTALTDTFTTDHFLHSPPPTGWALRQDSGDPYEVARKYIAAGHKGRVIFSDSLTAPKMLALVETFRNDFSDIVFGWGTDLTNDCGVPSLNIVIKPVNVDGAGCVKLSDDPGKANGTTEDIARYRALARD